MGEFNLVYEADRLAEYMQKHCYTEELSRQFESVLGHLLRNYEEHLPVVQEWNARASAGFDYYEDITDRLGEIYERVPAFEDVLGPLYMAIRGRYKGSALGQFFTPSSGCDLMAAISMSDSDFSEDKPITINEPCSGSGGILLAGARQVLSKYGKAGLRKLSITAGDLDPVCVAMTTIQFLYNWKHNDLPLHSFTIYQGNALGDPNEWKCWLSASSAPVIETNSQPKPETVTEASPVAVNEPKQFELAL